MPLALHQPLVGDGVSILLFIEQGYIAKSALEEKHGFTRGLLRSPYWSGFELLTSDYYFALP